MNGDTADHDSDGIGEFEPRADHRGQEAMRRASDHPLAGRVSHGGSGTAAAPSATSPARRGLGDAMIGIDSLAGIDPWPSERPRIDPEPPVMGWLADGTRAVLKESLSADTSLVLELGSWLGLSTRLIADLAPRAIVIAIDHWRGSPEHHGDPVLSAMLPTLYETFLALCWDYRDRIIPLRRSTLEGLALVADLGLRPDLIFIDAEHSYEAVSAEIELCLHRFPETVLVGDDYDWAGVRSGVDEAALRHGLTVETVGVPWGWKLRPPGTDRADAATAESASPVCRSLNRAGTP
jgi:hypothetical protein